MLRESEERLLEAYFDGACGSFGRWRAERLLRRNPDAVQYLERCRELRSVLRGYFSHDSMPQERSGDNSAEAFWARVENRINEEQYLANFLGERRVAEKPRGGVLGSGESRGSQRLAPERGYSVQEDRGIVVAWRERLGWMMTGAAAAAGVAAFALGGVSFPGDGSRGVGETAQVASNATFREDRSREVSTFDRASTFDNFSSQSARAEAIDSVRFDTVASSSLGIGATGNNSSDLSEELRFASREQRRREVQSATEIERAQALRDAERALEGGAVIAPVGNSNFGSNFGAPKTLEVDWVRSRGRVRVIPDPGERSAIIWVNRKHSQLLDPSLEARELFRSATPTVAMSLR